MQTDELTALLRGRDPAHIAVTLAGSDSVDLQKVMRVIDAVRASGATQIALATRSAR